MKVIAIERGYFGKLREPGDKFDVPAGEKAPWFVPDQADAKAKAGGNKSTSNSSDDLV